MGSRKWVYRFKPGMAEGHAGLPTLLGNKGANLSEMARMGLPVPPGFVITTDACRDFLDNGQVIRDEIRSEIMAAMHWMARVTSRSFGSAAAPLLISVRSGAAISMPGMMDTVLNLGLNDKTADALIAATGKTEFILDCYRRLIQMYGFVVLGVDAHRFEDILQDDLSLKGHGDETHLDEAGYRDLIAKFQSLILAATGCAYPQDVDAQFNATIGAVFQSWYSPRAVAYRAMQEIEGDAGTAVTIQAMVFGNMSAGSASGVAFTRNPSSGTPGLYGEYLPQAQGEDIVDGSRAPRSITEKGRLRRGDKAPSLQSAMPTAYGQLTEVAGKLERRFKDMQDIEFTIEDGQLWLLQTRTGKRTTEAAIRIAVDMLDEGLIEAAEAVARVPNEEFDRLVRPVIDPAFNADVIARGLPASPGTASGFLAFTPAEAVALSRAGKPAVLVRNETSPEDVEGINAASAVLTRRGGMTSHAAVITRAMGKPCIVGATTIRLVPDQGCLTVADRSIDRADPITIDGSSGRVIYGDVPMVDPPVSDYALRFRHLLHG